MTRDDLDELHALAASISEHRRGWRAHRHARSEAAARRRLEREMVKPIKRRRRHRLAAGIAVSLVVIVGATLIVTHLPGKPAPKPPRTAAQERALPGPVRAGRIAAHELTQLGQPPNIFACQRVYDTQRLGSGYGQAGPAWHADYMQACAGTS